MNIFIIENNDRDDNLGDQVISCELAELLSHYGKVFISGEPKAYHRFPQYGGDLSKSRLKRFFLGLFGVSYYRVFPAGGWGKVKPSKGGQELSSSEPRGLKSKLSAYCKSLMGVKSIVFGVSIEVAEDNPALDFFDWIGARDNRSIASIQKRKQIQTFYIPDLSFFEKTNHSEKNHDGKTVVSFREIFPASDNVMSAEKISRFLDLLLSLDSKPSELLHYFQVSEDESFIRSIQLASQKGRVVEEQIGFDDYKEFYGQTKLCVSNRLHCLLLAAMNGAIPIALTYKDHYKLIECFKKVGLEEYLFFFEDEDSWGVKLNSLFENIESNRAFILKSCESQRKLGFETLDQCFQMKAKF